MRLEKYHYVECGLEGVWLLNGFKFHASPRGGTVSISDIDSLHEAIGTHLCQNKRSLTGRDIRFLRHEMLMSQSALAKLLNVKVLTINRWENEKSGMPKSAEVLIRLLYLEQVRNRASKIKAVLKRIADVEDGIDQLEFVRSDDGSHNWELAA